MGGSLSTEGDPPKDQRNRASDANGKRLYSDTQVPGASKSLERLARRQVGAVGFYRARER